MHIYYSYIQQYHVIDSDKCDNTLQADRVLRPLDGYIDTYVFADRNGTRSCLRLCYGLFVWGRKTALLKLQLSGVAHSAKRKAWKQNSTRTKLREPLAAASVIVQVVWSVRPRMTRVVLQQRRWTVWTWRGTRFSLTHHVTYSLWISRVQLL